MLRSMSCTRKYRPIPTWLQLHFESESLHTASVLVYGGLAVFRGVCGIGEEHAFVSLGLFILADATWLEKGTLSAQERGKGRGLCDPAHHIPSAWRLLQSLEELEK